MGLPYNSSSGLPGRPTTTAKRPMHASKPRFVKAGMIAIEVLKTRSFCLPSVQFPSSYADKGYSVIDRLMFNSAYFDHERLIITCLMFR